MTPVPAPPPAAAPASSRPAAGVMLALGAVLLWGSNAVIGRHLALAGVSMTVLAFLRAAIGGVVLGLWLAATAPGALVPHQARWRDRWRWLALLCYGGNMLVFHWALARTSASAVMMLENTAPVVALFGGAWLFRERITGRALLALALALAGVGLVCLADPGLGATARSGAAWGNALAVLAGITWGGYTLACRGQARREGGVTGGTAATAGMLLGSAVLLAPMLLGATGWPRTTSAWAWVLVLGALHTGLATVLWRLALNHLSAYHASLLFLLTIVLTMANGRLFLGERVTPLMLAGAGSIVGAVLVLLKRSPRPPPTNPESP